MKKLKIGILGFGNMGSGHAENIMTGKTHKIELTAICDISDERRKAAREKYPDIAVSGVLISCDRLVKSFFIFFELLSADICRFLYFCIKSFSLFTNPIMFLSL